MLGALTPTFLQKGIATMAIPTANFLSYNSTGIALEKCTFINKICDENNVEFASIQEHFKKSKTIDKYFCKQFSKFNSYVIPGHRPQDQDSGRPKAGLAQLVKKGLGIRKDRIITSNFRIQAQILNFSSSRILWINTYLPTDPHTVQFDDIELNEALNEVSRIIDKSRCNDIIWNGDLNWDPNRKTGFSATMKNFVNRLSLVPLWDHFNVDYTHLHTDLISTSVLDHFIVSESLLPLVEECKVLHCGTNLSRHSPILLKLRVEDIPKKIEARSWKPKRPAWHKVTEEIMEDYRTDLEDRLSMRPVPDCMQCVDPHCQDQGHTHARDSYMLDILFSVIESSHFIIPLAGGCKAGPRRSGKTDGCIPGWRESVEPLCEDAKFWHAVWVSAGRPQDGDLHTAMARSRNIYHYGVRRAKRQSELYKAKKLFEASFTSDMELLKEMRKLRAGNDGIAELPDNVAGADGEDEIVEKFREVYSALYNSSSTADEVEVIRNKVRELVTNDSIQEVARINGKTVKAAAGLMKAGKTDISEGYRSDAILCGPDILFDQLALVFRSWCVHGTVTQSMLACAFLPLLKGPLKDPADPGSYRAIAGSSIILKLFDKVVLLLWGHLLCTDPLQFGYKEGTSTTQCSWLVHEVANHYLQQGSHPVVTLLDCSKAFDTCKFSTLFTRLLERGIPAIIVRVIIFVYEEQFAWVKWGSARSDVFSIVNGTRQGSILSPTLFALYVDELLVELRALGIGCHVAGVYMGAVGFCDDLLLIAPTRDGMQVMIKTCKRFAKHNNPLILTPLRANQNVFSCVD